MTSNTWHLQKGECTCWGCTLYLNGVFQLPVQSSYNPINVKLSSKVFGSSIRFQRYLRISKILPSFKVKPNPQYADLKHTTYKSWVIVRIIWACFQGTGPNPLLTWVWHWSKIEELWTISIQCAYLSGTIARHPRVKGWHSSGRFLWCPPQARPSAGGQRGRRRGCGRFWRAGGQCAQGKCEEFPSKKWCCCF